jgi:hypothetical protein
MQYVTNLINDFREGTTNSSTASKYTAINGLIYLAGGMLLIVWPGLTQTLFMDAAFVGHEQGLVRVIGLTVVVIGWLYVFGGRSGARQFVAASVVDRLIFIPVVLVPLAISGVSLIYCCRLRFLMWLSASVRGCFPVERCDCRTSLQVCTTSAVVSDTLGPRTGASGRRIPSGTLGSPAHTHVVREVCMGDQSTGITDDLVEPSHAPTDCTQLSISLGNLRRNSQ